MRFLRLSSLSYPMLASLLEVYFRAPARPYTFNPRSAVYTVGEYQFSNVPVTRAKQLSPRTGTGSPLPGDPSLEASPSESVSPRSPGASPAPARPPM